MKTYLVTINYFEGTELDQCIYHAETFQDFIKKLWENETEGKNLSPMTSLTGLTTDQEYLESGEDVLIDVNQIELMEQNEIIEVMTHYEYNDYGLINIYELDQNEKTGLKKLL